MINQFSGEPFHHVRPAPINTETTIQVDQAAHSVRLAFRASLIGREGENLARMRFHSRSKYKAKAMAERITPTTDQSIDFII